jgi:hypothetical protein
LRCTGQLGHARKIFVACHESIGAPEKCSFDDHIVVTVATDSKVARHRNHPSGVTQRRNVRRDFFRMKSVFPCDARAQKHFFEFNEERRAGNESETPSHQCCYDLRWSTGRIQQC